MGGDETEPPGKPLWEEMIGLTIEVGELRQDHDIAIRELREEVATLKADAQKPIESTEILRDIVHVLQEELSSCLRQLTSQQTELEAIKRTLKSDAKNSAKSKKDDEAATADAQEKKMIEIASLIDSYNFVRKDELERVRHSARVLSRKADGTVEEVHSLRREMQELVKSEMKKIGSDRERSTVGQLQKLRRNILEDMDKMTAQMREYDAKSLANAKHKQRPATENGADAHDLFKIASACQKQVETIRDDLIVFRASHQHSFDQSVETFSKIDSVLNDVTGRTRESFAQIDVVSAKVHDLREETRRNHQDLRHRIDQINHVVETQLGHITDVLVDIGCSLPRMRGVLGHKK